MGRPLYLQAPYVHVFLGAALVLASRELLVRRYLQVDPGSFRVLWSVTSVGAAIALLAPFRDVAMLSHPAVSF